MRYKFNEGSYTVRKEENDTISLMIKKTNQIIYLNSAARKILFDPNKTGDLDKFVQNLNVEDKEQAYKDYEELLYQLECFELVKIEKEEQESILGCKIAGEKDYNEIARFITANIKNQFSYSNVVNMKYYNPISIRTRQFNNNEYNILYFSEGKIIADLVVALPPKTSGFVVVYFNAVFFSKELNESDSKRVLKELLEYASKLFEKNFCKLRFHYFNEMQNWLLDTLENMGFNKVCTFEKELREDKALTVYDKFFDKNS